MKTKQTTPQSAIKILLFAGALVFTQAVHADLLPLVNPGFESPLLADGTYSQASSLPTGWTLTQGSFWGGLQNPTYMTPDGEQNVWARLNNYASGYESFTMSQNSTATAVAGMGYDIGFAVADTWAAGTTTTVRLLLGGTAVSETTVGTTASFAGFTTPVYVADALAAGKTLGVEIYVNNLGGVNDANFMLDAVTLNQFAVPEPASASLLAIGSLLLAFRRSR